MSNKRGWLLFMMLVATVGCVAAQNGLNQLFRTYLDHGGDQVVSRRDVGKILAWASTHQANVFDLIDEAGLFLSEHGVRITVWGKDLRAEVAGHYNLGGARVDAFLPLATLISLSVGSRNGHDGQVEIFLTEPHSGFLELGDFYLSQHYGFKSLAEKSLEGAFGVRVKEGWLTFNLDHVNRVKDPTGMGSPNFIAIWLKFFPRPKQWLINPIQPLE